MPESRTKPQRTCLGCRQAVEKDDLVRYVVAPGGEVLVDYRRRLPGRGAYTHVDRECLLAAARRQQFDRAFRGLNRKPEADALLATLADALLERILNLLGMARKSGQVISGSSLVMDSLNSADTALVLLAGDISPGIAEKVTGRAARAEIPYQTLFDKGLLGQVLGKGERSVVAVKSGPLADSIKKEMFRYKRIVGES